MPENEPQGDALEDFVAITTFATQQAKRLNYKETRDSIFRRAANVRRALRESRVPDAAIMARGLRAAEAMRAGSPGTDAEHEQWRHWYDEALALSLTIDAPDVGKGE